jgi:hypothetical protein
MTLPAFTVDPTPVEAPLGCPAPGEPDRVQRSVAWAAALDEQIRYDDAWGLLLTSPDGDFRLYGVEPRASIADWLVSYNAREARLVRDVPGWDSPR